MLYTLLLFVGVVLGVAAQLCLKEGLLRANIKHFRAMGLPVVLKRILNVFVVLGFILYGASLLLWLVILSQLELSYAYPMVSSGYFFVVLSSRFIFKEQVSWQRWASVVIIMFGVFLIGIS